MSNNFVPIKIKCIKEIFYFRFINNILLPHVLGKLFDHKTIKFIKLVGTSFMLIKSLLFGKLITDSVFIV